MALTDYNGLKQYIGLILLCVVLYIPGLTTLPPVDRDEARFAQATRQMLESRDFIRIRFQDPFSRKASPQKTNWYLLAPSSKCKVDRFAQPHLAL